MDEAPTAIHLNVNGIVHSIEMSGTHTMLVAISCTVSIHYSYVCAADMKTHA